MGIRVSTASPVNPEDLGNVVYDRQLHQRVGCLHSQRGGKSVNQDAAVLCQGFGAVDGVLGGVFDGHGKYGHFVSRIVKERLPVLLLDQKNVVAEDSDHGEASDPNESESEAASDGDLSSNKKFQEWEKACVDAFREMDETIKMAKKIDSAFSGTTAVVILKQEDDLIVANLGDSRAILGTKHENGVAAVQLTTDLKPGTPDEADRIRRSNGRVFALREEPDLQRAWLPRVYSPGMAMSRSFGDFVMKNYGIVSTPVVTHHRLTTDDLFVVLATDGVWDVLSNEEVVSIVCAAESREMAAKAVVDEAIRAWKTRTRNKPDDCTAVCFFLSKE